MAFLYQLTAPNGKAYLGITNHAPEQRWGGQQNKKYTCPHCSKSGGGGMLRWHFDHCKLNVENA